MHNSAARSEAAATALKSELVLRPLALPPPPHLSLPYPTLASTLLSFSSRTLLPSLAYISRSRRVLQFRGVSARLNDSSGPIRGFLLWYDETERKRSEREREDETRKALFGKAISLRIGFV